ncbi:MAG: NnrU family protein [Spirochaetaceae bacterium]|nr:NnrU family protein [Myxococcales bacterium]MCB9725732.1 NnrU family protein [Spirochaetaceae bacterium]
MSWLVLGLLLFLGIHSISIVNEPLRDRMVERLGPWPWKGVYSLPAAAGFVLLVVGYGLARQDPVVLYTPPTWLRHVALIVLLPALPLFVSTYFPGRIRRFVANPTLVATELWAGAHLLANGLLADVLLFGGFLVWAVADHLSLARRRPRAIPTLPERPANDAIAIALGLALYAAIVLGLHRLVIGVPVLPA